MATHRGGASFASDAHRVKVLEQSRRVHEFSDYAAERAMRHEVEGHVLEDAAMSFVSESVQVQQPGAASNGPPHRQGLGRRVVVARVRFGSQSVGARALLRVRAELRPDRNREPGRRGFIDTRHKRPDEHKAELAQRHVTVIKQVLITPVDVHEIDDVAAEDRGALLIDVEQNGERLEVYAELVENLLHVSEAVQAHLFSFCGVW
jgi:hypothetical protein